MAAMTTRNLHTAMQRSLQAYAEAGRHAGCPRDQIERFVGSGYVAQPHQLALHALARRADDATGPVLIGFGGRRGPGKTHATLAQIGLDDCQRVAGLKYLFLRKVAKAGRESFDDVRRKLFTILNPHYQKQSGILEFENGSRIVLGHFQHENDIDSYLGIEYDGAAVEEATQLSYNKLQLLRGSIRTTKAWRPRLYLTTNPGGIGHQWFRSMFVLPWRSGTETETRFLPASADQNVYLNDEYRAWLNGLTGVLGRMWRDGDWDVAGGSYFSTWRDDRHVLDTLAGLTFVSFWLAMDYGWTHFTVVYLFGKTSDGVVIILDEHYARRSLITEHVAGLAALLVRNGVEKHQLRTFVAGTDVFAKKHDGSTIADEWQRHGWTLTGAITDRINGAQTVVSRMGKEGVKEPTLLVSRRCVGLIATLPLLLSDPHRPEDVLKVDADAATEDPTGDDFYDAARYGVMVEGSAGAAIIDHYLNLYGKK